MSRETGRGGVPPPPAVWEAAILAARLGQRASCPLKSTQAPQKPRAITVRNNHTSRNRPVFCISCLTTIFSSFSAFIFALHHYNTTLTIILFPFWFQGNVSLIRMVDYFRMKIGQTLPQQRCCNVPNRSLTPVQVLHEVFFGHGTA